MCKVKEFVITNEKGIHARPATKFVQTVADYECEVEVTNLSSGAIADGRSIMSVLTLTASKGQIIKLKVNGKDEDELMFALERLIENGFEQA